MLCFRSTVRGVTWSVTENGSVGQVGLNILSDSEIVQESSSHGIDQRKCDLTGNRQG